MNNIMQHLNALDELDAYIAFLSGLKSSAVDALARATTDIEKARAEARLSAYALALTEAVIMRHNLEVR